MFRGAAGETPRHALLCIQSLQVNEEKTVLPGGRGLCCWKNSHNHVCNGERCPVHCDTGWRPCSRALWTTAQLGPWGCPGYRGGGERGDLLSHAGELWGLGVLRAGSCRQKSVAVMTPDPLAKEPWFGTPLSHLLVRDLTSRASVSPSLLTWYSKTLLTIINVNPCNALSMGAGRTKLLD